MVKTAVVEKPGVLTLREVPMPEPGEYGALCKMLYGATCSGTDRHLLHGRIPWPVYYPTAVGHESIGQVVAVGEKARNYKIGDMVTRVGLRDEDCKKSGLNHNWGGFSSYGVAMDYMAMRDDGLDRAEWGRYTVNHVIPPDFDPRAATMIITWRETLSYMLRMGVYEGSSVLVLGSGGNGLSFIHLAKALGARHVSAVGSAGRRENAERAGADAYYDYRTADWDKNLSDNGKVGSGGSAGSFDFIIDAAASEDGLRRSLKYLKPGGVCGVYALETDPSKRVLIAPSDSKGFSYYIGSYDEEETNDRVVALVRDGKLDASIWLDYGHIFELDDILAVYENIENKRFVKALVRL